MAINRKSRRAPESEEYFEEQEEKVTRRPADDADEDEAEAPRKRRSRRDDDDEDERPARRSRRRDEDDDDEDEAPRKRRSRRDDDDEDEAPRKRRFRGPDEADDDEDDIDPDDQPNDKSSLVQSGWGAAKKTMSESSQFTNDFKFDEEPQVIKFLRTEPLVYQSHWVERKGKKSFVCLGKNCPLCKAGDSPSPKFAWPVLNFGMDVPTAQLVVCGTKLAKQLEKHDGDKRNGPLDKLYWAVSRTGKAQSTSYVLEPVKERDLAADWDIDPDDALDAIEETKVPGGEAINVTSRDDLIEIARELR